MSKAQGQKIVIRFTENLTGDITGRNDPPVGGWKIGADVAAAGTASAGSTRQASNSADKALDRITTTHWQPVYRVLSWHKVDLGAEKDIKGYAIRTPNADGYPTAYRVEASDDNATWITIHNAGNPGGQGVTQTVTFAEVYSYRYWQIVVTARSNNYAGLAEVYYYEKVPIGNEQAFTVTGVQPMWTNINNGSLGPLVAGSYIVDSVGPTDPADSKQILLTMQDLKRFNSVEGNLTVVYNASLGSLAGAGGVVESFTVELMPEDLVRFINPYWTERILASVSALTTTLSRVYQMVVGDGPNPATDPKSVKPVRAYDPGPPEVLEQEKGVYGDEGNEKIGASITDLDITLTYTGGIDP